MAVATQMHQHWYYWLLGITYYYNILHIQHCHVLVDHHHLTL